MSRKPFMAVKTVRHTEFEDPTTGSIVSGHFLPTGEKPVTDAITYFRSQIRQNTQLLREPDGLYTWIIKEKGGQKTLIAARTRSKQELGTLHKNLDDFTPEYGSVLYAGEYSKTGTSVIFNLQSGTYMKGHFSRMKDIPTQDREQEEIIRIVTSEFTKAGFTAISFNAYNGEEREKQLAGTPMINTAPIVSTPDNVATYTKYFKFVPKVGAGRRTRRKRRSTRAQSHRKRVRR